jgi:hypothetical protein
VVLADDDVLLREDRAGLLERSGFKVAGQSDDSAELISLVREHQAELAISLRADLNLHVRGGKQVQVPGRVAWPATVRGDNDAVVTRSAVRCIGTPSLTGVPTDRGEHERAAGW